MIQEVLSAFESAEEDVIVITREACYRYKYELNKKQRENVIDKVKQIMEINTEHWDMEWEFKAREQIK